MEIIKQEQRALKKGNLVNLFMAIAGVLIALLSNSSALLMDGLFSFIQFISTVTATKISKDMGEKNIEKYPMGQQTKEVLYVLFRSFLILVLTISFLVNSIKKIIDFVVFSKEIPIINTKYLLIYGIIMVVLCLFLVVIYNWHNKKINNISSILKTEAIGALMDSIVSIAAVGALILVEAVQALSPIRPIADAILVVVISVFFLKEPIKIFFKQIVILSRKRTNYKEEIEIKELLKKEVCHATVEALFIWSLGKTKEVYIKLKIEDSLTVKDVVDVKRNIEEIINNRDKQSIVIINI